MSSGVSSATTSPLPREPAGLAELSSLRYGVERAAALAIDVSDLAWTRDGLEVMIRRSKTDQEGAGRKVGIPYGGNPATCPVRAVRGWLDAAGISDGPVFRSVSRSGLATTAAKAGKSERSIMAQTGHRSVTMVRRYIRDASLFSDNAATGLGL